ncbi:MAG: tRNA 2-thiouridine(34) synthase MnmA [Spirochaetia bacterium]|nr:tRNA 2-thiouridine(34) synthase MnmA [Spirochaetia bacterium]
MVGMSGGIDSTVVAYLLKQKGYDVIGVTMLLWSQRSNLTGKASKGNFCFSADKSQDIDRIQQLCSMIGIEHHVLNLSRNFEDVVLRNFKDEYLDGRTPNPCVWCNPTIKFGAMWDELESQGITFDAFATGHYARIEYENGRYCLKRGIDDLKDQSYFLYRLGQRQLSKILFPLGGMHKDDVRKIDVAQGFHPEAQQESQDFYDGDYADLLGVGDQQGDIVDEDGHKLGTHHGIFHYTLGQRRGLGISSKEPLYVIALDPAHNQVIVGNEASTYSTAVMADHVVWGSQLDFSTEGLQAKIRSTGKPVNVSAEKISDDQIRATFTAPVKAATPGQSLVIYQGDTVVAGGIISSVG